MIFELEFSNSENEAVVNVGPLPNGETMVFTLNIGSLCAALMADYFNGLFDTYMANERREAYNEGFRDGDGKQRRRVEFNGE